MAAMSNGKLKARLRSLVRRNRIGSVYAERIMDEMMERGMFVPLAVILNGGSK